MKNDFYRIVEFSANIFFLRFAHHRWVFVIILQSEQIRKKWRECYEKKSFSIWKRANIIAQKGHIIRINNALNVLKMNTKKNKKKKVDENNLDRLALVCLGSVKSLPTTVISIKLNDTINAYENIVSRAEHTGSTNVDNGKA